MKSSTPRAYPHTYRLESGKAVVSTAYEKLASLQVRAFRACHERSRRVPQQPRYESGFSRRAMALYPFTGFFPQPVQARYEILNLNCLPAVIGRPHETRR